MPVWFQNLWVQLPSFSASQVQWSITKGSIIHSRQVQLSYFIVEDAEDHRVENMSLPCIQSPALRVRIFFLIASDIKALLCLHISCHQSSPLTSLLETALSETSGILPIAKWNKLLSVLCLSMWGSSHCWPASFFCTSRSSYFLTLVYAVSPASLYQLCFTAWQAPPKVSSLKQQLFI